MTATTTSIHIAKSVRIQFEGRGRRIQYYIPAGMSGDAFKKFKQDFAVVIEEAKKVLFASYRKLKVSESKKKTSKKRSSSKTSKKNIDSVVAIATVSDRKRLAKNLIVIEETYIANGKKFASYEEVVEYAKKHSLRITNTKKAENNTHLIELTSL